MRRLFTTILFLAAVLSTAAQEKITDRMQTNEWGKGTVTIHQPEALYRQLGSIYNPGTSGRVVQAKGYRIQIYAGGNTRSARDGALGAAQAIRSAFPDLPVYTEFVSPRWVCRVGDYRTYAEANEMLREIRKLGTFKELTILPNQTINLKL